MNKWFNARKASVRNIPLISGSAGASERWISYRLWGRLSKWEKHRLLHSWSIRQEFGADLRAVHCSTMSKFLGNMCQYGLQARHIPMTKVRIKVFPASIEKGRKMATLLPQFQYNKFDASALFSLSVRLHLYTSTITFCCMMHIPVSTR